MQNRREAILNVLEANTFVSAGGVTYLNGTSLQLAGLLDVALFQKANQEKPSNIENHAGSKYLRKIYCPIEGRVDVYAVLEAFGITCPARQHAIKKLLCAGLRGKGSQMQDLEEAINSCGPRILELQRIREQNMVTD